MKNTVDRVWEYSLNNPEGFTLNIDTFKEVKFGIVVAYAATQNHFGKDKINRVINHANSHNKTIGGWHNSENDQYYFDSVRVFPNSELQQAIEFAKQNKQLAIFDLTNLREIRIEG